MCPEITGFIWKIEVWEFVLLFYFLILFRRSNFFKKALDQVFAVQTMMQVFLYIPAVVPGSIPMAQEWPDQS